MTDTPTPAPQGDRKAPQPAVDAASRVYAAVWDWRAARDPATERDERRRRAAAARREGWLRAAVGIVAAGLLYLWKPPFGLFVAAVTVVLLLLALASPLGAYRKVSIALERFAYGVAMAVTWVLMTLLYYLVVFPLGLGLRAGGSLRLRRAPDPREGTYWTPVTWVRKGLDTYRRQF